MTESIKQWIAEQAKANAGWSGLLADNSRTIYSKGLSKGIEITEGFGPWAAKEGVMWNEETKKWHCPINGLLTPSQLLEKYLVYLKTLEP